MGLSLFSLFAFFHFSLSGTVAVTSLVVYISLFSLSWGPIPWFVCVPLCACVCVFERERESIQFRFECKKENFPNEHQILRTFFLKRMMIPQILPPPVKGEGTSAAAAFGTVNSFVIVTSFQTLEAIVGTKEVEF